MNNCREAGVTLIEVLIAVLVLAIGMIGTIGLQGMAKHGNFEALQRTQAVYIAKDISERMSANRANVWENYEGVYSGSLSAPSTNCLGSAADCSATQLATWDLYQFDQAILGASQTINSTESVGGMINAEGCIDVDGGLITIAIVWEGIPLSTPVSLPASLSECGDHISANERRTYLFQTFLGV